MKRNYWRVVSWVLLWVVFLIKGVWMLDPDFGQHLKTGEVIVRSGLPMTDPFSYTMSSWRYIDHAWVSDVLIWAGYKTGGMWLLAAAYAAMATGALWLVTDKGRWGLVAAILGAAVFMGRMGVRPQVVDWLMTAVVLRHLNEDWWRKRKWVVPILFGVWANLHGGVAIGLAILGAKTVGLWWEGKLKFSDTAVLGLAMAATLANPYGVGLWRQIGLEVADVSLKKTVAEWRPWYGSVDFGFWMLAAMIGMWGWRYRKKIGWGEWLILGGTFAAGLSSLRHMAIFALTAAWVLGKVLVGFEEDFGRKHEVKQRLDWFYGLMMGVSLLVLAVQGGVELWGARQVSEERFYPIKAVEWLKSKPVKGNLFSDYGWGGYLIWKLPEKKTFVDGRMPSWKRPSGSAFEDYLDIVWREKDFGPVFELYGVEAVLWPKRYSDWFKNSKEKSFPDRLEIAGWEKIYEDRVSVIYNKQYEEVH